MKDAPDIRSAGRWVDYHVAEASHPTRSDQWRTVVGAILLRNRAWKIGGPSQSRRSMNEYGQFAMRTWRMLVPAVHAEIADPERFFRELGEQAANQVVDLTRQLQGPDLPNETYFQKVGRIQAAKMQAEEIVRNDLLTPSRELWQEEDEPDRPDLAILQAMDAEEAGQTEPDRLQPYD